MIGILRFLGYFDSMFCGSYGGVEGGAGDAGVEGSVDSKTLCFRGVLKIRLS